MIEPLVIALISYIAGILIGYFCKIPVLLLILTGCIGLVLGLNNELRSWQKNRLYFVAVAIILGVVMFQWQENQNKGNISWLAGHWTSFTGTVCEEPDVRFNAVNYVIRVEDISLMTDGTAGSQNPARPSGRILLTVGQPSEQYAYGDQILVKGAPELPKAPGNPGEFNYRRYLEAKGIQLVVKSWQGVRIQKIGIGSINPLVDICLRVKHRLMAVLAATMSPRHSGLMGGILFGSCGLIDAQSRNDFALTGVVHILSVSGYHVVLLVSFCLFVGNSLRLNRTAVNIMTVTVTGIYTIMSGASPPAVRALLMVWILLLARNTRHKYHWPSALSLAALLILLFSPVTLFNAGFQLSFLATWGILYLVPVVKCLLLRGFGLLAGWFPSDQGVWSEVGQAVAVSFAAQFAVLPLTSYYFNYFSLVSLPANLVIVPLISLCMLLGGCAAILGIIWLPLAEVINTSNGLILEAVLTLAHYLAGLPYAIVPVKQPNFLGIACFYLVLVAIIESITKPEITLRVRRLWALHRSKTVPVVLAVVTVVLWQGIVFAGAGSLEITFLDVGQGDAAIFGCPGGRTVILDTGGLQGGGQSSYNPGEKVVLPFLRRKGIDKIDLLILSHIHADHIQGAEALLGKVPVDMIVVNDQFAKSPEGNSLVNSFRAKGTQIRIITEGDCIIVEENITLENLISQGETASGDSNDDSLVMRLSYGEFHVLFTGDAGETVLKAISGAAAPVHAEIVKVPHHGSKNSWDEQFYRTVDPQLAIISVGPNWFGHPSAQVLAGLSGLGIPAYRTDNDGAITVRSKGHGYQIETSKK